ncbi:hypothetical protein L195_g062343, partial [Trifolium pratense]
MEILLQPQGEVNVHTISQHPNSRNVIQLWFRIVANHSHILHPPLTPSTVDWGETCQAQPSRERGGRVLQPRSARPTYRALKFLS